VRNSPSAAPARRSRTPGSSSAHLPDQGRAEDRLEALQRPRPARPRARGQGARRRGLGNTRTRMRASRARSCVAPAPRLAKSQSVRSAPSSRPGCGSAHPHLASGQNEIARDPHSGRPGPGRSASITTVTRRPASSRAHSGCHALSPGTANALHPWQRAASMSGDPSTSRHVNAQIGGGWASTAREGCPTPRESSRRLRARARSATHPCSSPALLRIGKITRPRSNPTPSANSVSRSHSARCSGHITRSGQRIRPRSARQRSISRSLTASALAGSTGGRTETPSDARATSRRPFQPPPFNTGI